MNKTEAERRKMILKKKKTLFSSVLDTVDFKEPILILMRRTQQAEFFENATKGEFEYEHSDGTTRKIFLTPKYLQAFPYGKTTFRGYICHEDSPLPLPNEPEITTETIGIAIDKTLNDINNWKAKEWTAKGNFFWKIAIGIVSIIGMYILYRVLFPQAPSNDTQAVEVAKTTVSILNTTPTVI